MSVGFTPGPWDYYYDGESHKVVEADGGLVGKFIDACEARFAATSPDLFAALEPFAAAAIDCLDDEEDRGSMWEHPAAMDITVGDLRRAAVACRKARGDLVNPYEGGRDG